MNFLYKFLRCIFLPAIIITVTLPVSAQIISSVQSFNDNAGNFSSFTPQKNCINQGKLASLTPAAYRTNPDFGKLFIGKHFEDSAQWYERINKRTLKSRSYVNINDTTEVMIEYGYSNLNYLDESGWIRAVDTKLKPTGDEWSAEQQEIPIYLYKDASTALSLGNKQVMVFNKNVQLNGNNTSTSDYTVGDDGIYIKNIFRGVDKIIRFGRGRVETDYRINKPLKLSSDLVISEDILLPDGYTISENKDYDDAIDNSGSFVVKDANGKIAAEIKSPFCYDSSGNSMMGSYQIRKEEGKYRLDAIVSSLWLNDALRQYPVTVDPIITGPTTVYAGPIIPSCIFPSYDSGIIQIIIPPAVTMTSFFVQGDFYATVLSPLGNGELKFTTNCGTTGWLVDHAAGYTSYGPSWFRIPIQDFIRDGFTFTFCNTPLCSQDTFDLTMSVARDSLGAGCNTTYIYYDPANTFGTPFEGYVIGRTVDSVGSGWSISPNPGCGNNCSLTLSATTGYGVPPYTITHPWAAGSETYGSYSTITGTSNGDTTLTLTIPNCPISACDSNPITVPPPKITDACGDTVAGLGSLTLKVYPLPNVITALSSDTFCTGGSVNIALTSCVNGTTYVWTGSDGSSGASSPINDVPSNAENITYTVTPTSPHGCVGTPSSISIVAISQPVASFNLNPATPCLNGTITATYTGTNIPGATYAWTSTGGTPASGTNTTGTYQVSYATSGSHTITLVVTLNGCSSAPLNVVATVAASPPVTVSASPATICLNSSTSLVAKNATTYTWTPSSGLSATSGGNVTAIPTTTTTYTVTGTGSCTSSQTVVVTVDTLPQIIITPSSPSICVNGSVTIKASGAVSYTWGPSLGLSSTSGSSVVANPITTSTYVITGTDGNNCKNKDTFTVSIYIQPNITIKPLNPAVCIGDSIKLTAEGANTYTWTPSTGLSVTNDSIVMASPPATITYTINGIGIGGCPGSTTVKVTVNPLPKVMVLPQIKTICEGITLPLTANGGITYQWDNLPGLSSDTGANVTVTPLITTTYSVTATDANGCSDSASSIITVLPAPAVTINPPNPTICAGKSISITASGGINYQWFPAIGLSATSGATVTANPTATSVYIVSTTNANGCLGADTFVVVVDPKPNIVITPKDPTVCIGQSVDLKASGASTYEWSPSNSLSATTGSSVIANPSTDTSYTIIGTDKNGCIDTTSVTVKVTPHLTLAINSVPSSDTVCSGNSVVLTVSGGTTYLWSPSASLSSATDSIVTAKPVNTTTYIVTAMNTGGCTGADTVAVTVLPLPVVSVSGLNSSYCINASSVTLNGGEPTGGTYSGPGVSSDMFNPALAGVGGPYSIIYSYTDSNNCTNTADEMVNITALPDIKIIPDSGVICSGIPVTLTATGASTYTWSPPTALSSTNTNMVIADPTTVIVYTVTGTDNFGCVDSTTVKVTQGTLPPVGFFTMIPNSCQPQQVMFTDTFKGATTYLWNFGDSLTAKVQNPLHVYVNPGNYRVALTVSNIQGCIDTTSADEYVVSADFVAAPNAFVPNENGANAYFTPHMLCQSYTDYVFCIYNRWGQLLFQTNDATAGWDGRYAGLLEPTGVYIYYIKFKCGTCDVLKKGNITLF